MIGNYRNSSLGSNDDDASSTRENDNGAIIEEMKPSHTSKMMMPPLKELSKNRKNETIDEVSCEYGDSETPASFSLHRNSSTLINPASRKMS